MAKNDIKLTIDRKRWKRGNDGENSFLVTDTGQMCCLGFLGLACGVKKIAMSGKAVPNELNPSDRARYPGELKNLKSYRLNNLGSKLMEANDTANVKDREKNITALMKQAGVTVTFKG